MKPQPTLQCKTRSHFSTAPETDEIQKLSFLQRKISWLCTLLSSLCCKIHVKQPMSDVHTVTLKNQQIRKLYIATWLFVIKDPKFIYRRAPNFGDHVLRKNLDPPSLQKLQINLKDFFSCRKCICCRTVKVSNRAVLRIVSDDESFSID